MTDISMQDLWRGTVDEIITKFNGKVIYNDKSLTRCLITINSLRVSSYFMNDDDGWIFRPLIPHGRCLRVSVKDKYGSAAERVINLYDYDILKETIRTFDGWLRGHHS